MRQLIAVLVLLCFGITVPSAALTLRVCLMDDSLMGGGFGSSEMVEPGADRSCSDCCKKDKSCCAELKKLPDSTIRSGDAELPELVVMDLPPAVFQVSLDVLPTQLRCHPSVAIRGPDPPCSRRAVLAVWRI